MTDMHTFDSRTAVEAFIRGHVERGLQGADLTGDKQEAVRLVSAGFVRYFGQVTRDQERDTGQPVIPSGRQALVVPRQHWAIQNEDLMICVEFSALLAQLIAGYDGPSPERVIIGFVAIAVRVLLTVYRKGVRLNLDQTRLLVSLKRMPSAATLADLAAELNDEESQVAAVLDSLAQVRRTDSRVVALVAQSADGRWACNDV